MHAKEAEWLASQFQNMISYTIVAAYLSISDQNRTVYNIA